MDTAEIKQKVDDTADGVRDLVRLFADREMVLEMASDREVLDEMETNMMVLVSAGQALGDQLGRVRRLARELDAATDPATILEVR